MDGSDIYKAVNSIRSGIRELSLRNVSTSAWRNSDMDAFSKSTHEEDDEEALKWASLEKLPTFCTSAWRNSDMDAFSKSTHEEDDEEALKWVSLEKLPTFDRLKKGLLFGSTGLSHEVDVENLRPEDRKHLLDRLVKTADEDNVGFLRGLETDLIGVVEFLPSTSELKKAYNRP
ncbi:hypothetical protein Tco_1098084 [Tanacetum coccineum]